MGKTGRWLHLALWLILGCSGSSGSNIIDVALRTDFAPGTEFDVVSVTVGEGDRRAEFDHGVRLDRDYVEGVRLGEAQLTPGEVTIRVSLRQNGVLVIDRIVTVDLRSPRTIATVVITRDCQGVVCPGEGNPLFESCLGGQCVDPRCTVETPEFCPPAECETRTCTSDVACVVPMCTDGLCFAVASDRLCPAGQVCAPSMGCVAGSIDGGNMDAGVSDVVMSDAGMPDTSIDASASCDDGVRNGTESDVDCGGVCPSCDDGATCSVAENCTSGVCDTLCLAPSCTDGVQNGTETEVDCGGGCTCSTICDDQTEIPLLECRALEALYNSAGGSEWTNVVGWFSDESPCSWSGITCGGGNVRELRVDEDELSGSLPAALGNLSELNVLQIDRRGCCLATTELSGSIPAALGRLSRLQTLSLRRHQLSGSIPPALADLTFLDALVLETNSLTGRIPAELGSMPALRHLNLSQNSLSGPIPVELGNLSVLEILALDRNQLTGGIPTEELGNLNLLRTLWLSNNPLGGTLPVSLATISGLESLRLATVGLTGPIPPELGDLSRLEILVLGGNFLTGTIPAELGGLPSLRELSLPANQLMGTIPPELGNLSTLVELDLHGNLLSGAIPAELGNLSQLRLLILDRNSLNGPLPPELGNLSSLINLILYSNSFSGPLPAELGSLSSLVLLDVEDNSLSGSIPNSLMGMTSLQRILLCPNLGLTASPPMQAWLGAIATNDWSDGC